MTALTRADLEILLRADPPLAEGLVDPLAQLQPNGLDLTLGDIWALDSAASLGHLERELPGRRALTFDEAGWITLAPGAYLVRFSETLRMPPDLVALGRPRSTLARSGVGLVLAIWDAGYQGRSEALLVVHNRHGFRVQHRARIAQLVFFRTTAPTEGYDGAYQGENLG